MITVGRYYDSTDNDNAKVVDVKLRIGCVWCVTEMSIFSHLASTTILCVGVDIWDVGSLEYIGPTHILKKPTFKHLTSNI